MDQPDRPKATFLSAIRFGWNRGRNSDFSLASRRLQGLLVAFHGYCAAFICLLSIVAVIFRRNVVGNLEGAAITGAIAFALIRLGNSIRRSAIQR
jgi:hypothetical protein